MNPLFMYAGKFSVPAGLFLGGIIETVAQTPDSAQAQLKIALYALIGSAFVAVIGGAALVASTIISTKNRAAVPVAASSDTAKDLLIQKQAEMIVSLENDKTRLKRRVSKLERDRDARG